MTDSIVYVGLMFIPLILYAKNTRMAQGKVVILFSVMTESTSPDIEPDTISVLRFMFSSN